MQDTRSGEMIPVPEDIIKDTAGIKNKFERLSQIKSRMAPTIPKEFQGALLEKGEILDIKGGKFKVHAITAGRVYLTPLPA